MAVPREFDLFLSHASPDKEWVTGLSIALEDLDVKTFLDAKDIEAGENFVLTLSDALKTSRFLVLVLSPHSVGRPWVEQEWTAFVAEHGPSGSLFTLLLDEVDLPTILKPIQQIDARHRDAEVVAAELAYVVGRRDRQQAAGTESPPRTAHFAFVLAREGADDEERICVTRVDRRDVTPPWRTDSGFAFAYMEFTRLMQEETTDGGQAAEITRHGTTLGKLLFGLLFDEKGAKSLEEAAAPGKPHPLVTIRSDDDLLLSLPWELLHHDGSFMVRDRRIDLVRTTGTVGFRALLSEPDRYFTLVVNVSAPDGSKLDYEAESYRITTALSERCEFTPTELGTLDDLLQTTKDVKPTGIHFSGHGLPGHLDFEDLEGGRETVAVTELVSELRRVLPGELPPFFYLASCHGNEPLAVENDNAGAQSSAAELHRQGVAQVVGYFGPIVDMLSTQAEAEFYRAIAAGESTRYAVRQARRELESPVQAPSGHRPAAAPRVTPSRNASDPVAAAAPSSGSTGTHPFAWSQLVLYHRGPDQPLSLPVPPEELQRRNEALQRTFTEIGPFKFLSTGFVGRRKSLHDIRRRVREGQRIFVLQGLGGLGKTTLAYQMLPLLKPEGAPLVLWCQATEKAADPMAELLDQLLAYCRKRFGTDWEGVVQQVDHAGGEPMQRFGMFLSVLVQRVKRLVVYLDNLESLLVGPADEMATKRDPKALGEWKSQALESTWTMLAEAAETTGHLLLVASCRYRNAAFEESLVAVPPLPRDALFRLMGWFPALRKLALPNRARLVQRLAGHPRGVELTNDLVAASFARWENRYGERPVLMADANQAEVDSEWTDLIGPALPEVEEQLWEDLLLSEIWERVLDDRARRMLSRMTLLRWPWQWEQMKVLGETDESDKQAQDTAEQLLGTSLIEQMELEVPVGQGRMVSVRHFMLHPSIAQFVRAQVRIDHPLRETLHRRVGDYLEGKATETRQFEIGVEAGYHLLEAGEYDRAHELLWSCSNWLRRRGQLREGLGIVTPLLEESVLRQLEPERAAKLLSTAGLYNSALGETRRAVRYFEHAVEIARETGWTLGEAEALMNLGNISFDLRDMPTAIECHEKVLALGEDTGDLTLKGAALGGLANTHAHLGDLETALDYQSKSLEISRQLQNRDSEGTDLGNLGTVYYRLGDLRKAIECFEAALAISREAGDRQSESADLGNLGNVYRRLGELGRAIEYFEQTLRICRERQDRRGEGLSLANLAWSYAELGEAHRAEGLATQALKIGQEVEDPQTVGLAQDILQNVRSGS